MKKVLVIGERPGPNTDPSRPLFPHTTTGAAANLIRLMGISQEQYLTEVLRYNAVDEFHTSTSAPCVRERVWDKIAYHLACYGEEARVLFLGRSAANAGMKWVRTLPFGESRVNFMVIPHPSGRNRYYNSQANKDFIIQSLRKFIGTLQSS